MKYKSIITVGIICLSAYFLQAESVQNIQSLDGETRNRLERLIGSGGSGGSFDATQNINFTGINTFGAVVTNLAAVVMTNSLSVSPILQVNTNGVNPATGSTVTIRPSPSAGGVADLSVRGSAGAGIAGFLDSGPLWSIDHSGGTVRFVGNGSGFSELVFLAAGGNTLRLGATTATLGEGSNSLLTFNGATHTIAHNPQVNTDVWRWPSAGGTITNGTSIESLGTVAASTLIARGASVWDNGTNATSTIRVNSGTGRLITEANYTIVTNAPTATTPVINAIMTNSNQRMRVNVGVIIPTGLTQVSSAFLYTINGAVTNKMGTTMGSAGFSGVITGTVYGVVNPNALFIISNNNAAAGAVTIDPSLFNLNYE